VVSLEDLSLAGNLIPHSWYHKITNSRGQPDSNAIIILAEIVYWYRSTKKGNSHKFYGASLQLGYDHFINKLNFTRDQIRNALKKLEELNLVYRAFKTESKFGSNYSNIMFLELKIETLRSITSCYLNEKSKTDNNMLCSEEKSYKDTLFSDPISKFTTPSSEICEVNKEYKENNRNRYLDESNVSKFSSEILVEANSVKDNSSFCSEQGREPEIKSDHLNQNKDSLSLKGLFEKVSSVKQTFSREKLQSIDYYLPLTEQDEWTLSKRVGKGFGLTFINALAHKLSVKYAGHRFKDKETFLNYLTKALMNEMHSPEKVNNTNFVYLSPEERYLERVELSNDTSYVGQIKRRITREFQANLAVEILKKCYFPNIAKDTKNYTFYVNDESFSLEEKNQEKLKKIILETTERYDLITGEHFKLKEVRIIKRKRYTEEKNKVKTVINSSLIESNIDPMWQRVRERLQARYNPETDKSWFSRIEFSYEVTEGRVNLGFDRKFESEFFENNYGSTVNKYIRDEIESLYEINHQIKGSNELVNVWFKAKPRSLNQDEQYNVSFQNLMAEQSIGQNVLCSV
jgi:hypothetical protein